MIIESSLPFSSIRKYELQMVTEIDYVVYNYSDLREYYTLIMNITYASSTKQERIICNTLIPFFCRLRDFVVQNPDGMNEQDWFDYFNAIILRMKSLLSHMREDIYFYQPSLEVQEFCDYHGFKYIVIDSIEEMQRLITQRAKCKAIY